MHGKESHERPIFAELTARQRCMFSSKWIEMSIYETRLFAAHISISYRW